MIVFSQQSKKMKWN